MRKNECSGLGRVVSDDIFKLAGKGHFEPSKAPETDLFSIDHVGTCPGTLPFASFCLVAWLCLTTMRLCLLVHLLPVPSSSSATSTASNYPRTTMYDTVGHPCWTLLISARARSMASHQWDPSSESTRPARLHGSRPSSDDALIVTRTFAFILLASGPAQWFLTRPRQCVEDGRNPHVPINQPDHRQFPFVAQRFCSGSASEARE